MVLEERCCLQWEHNIKGPALSGNGETFTVTRVQMYSEEGQGQGIVLGPSNKPFSLPAKKSGF